MLSDRFRMRLKPALFLSLLLPGLAAAADYPHHVLPAIQVQAAIEESKDEPLRYAVAQPTNLNTPDGAWDSPAEGIARWRLGIESQGAESLALRLEDLRLPAGGALRWIGEDSGDVQGPFVASDSGTLWLPVVRGSRAVLEVRLPATLKDQFGLRIAEAQHGYLGFQPETTAKGQFGTSGSCNVDVACSTANDWRTQLRSVVLLTANNVARCTGTLVNNTLADAKPYVLTANHCEFGSPAFPISGVRAYFNLNRAGCASGNSGSITQNIAAAELVAQNTSSDFALLLLQNPQSGTKVTDFNVFFAGWDVNGSPPTSGAAIHHPLGDDKKISIYGSGVTKRNNVAVGDFVVDAWEVRWTRGTTEKGSSGAALWNQNGQIIGTLSGGTAACNLNGSPNNDPDYFGRLELAWSGEDKAAGSSLQPFLAPGNTSVRSLNGLDRGTNSPPSVVDPPNPNAGGSGGGALPALFLAGLMGLGLLRRRTRRLRP